MKPLKNPAYCLAFKDINSKGEITLLLFRKYSLYLSAIEILEDQYTVTKMNFCNLDKEDEWNFDVITHLDDIEEYID